MTTLQQLTGTNPTAHPNGAQPMTTATAITALLATGFANVKTADERASDMRDEANAAGDKRDNDKLAWLAALGQTAYRDNWLMDTVNAAIAAFVKADTSNNTKSRDNYVANIRKVVHPNVRMNVTGYVALADEAYALDTKLMRGVHRAKYHYVLNKLVADGIAGKPVPLTAQDAVAATRITASSKVAIVKTARAMLKRTIAALTTMRDDDFEDASLDTAIGALMKLNTEDGMGAAYDIRKNLKDAQRNVDDAIVAARVDRVTAPKAQVLGIGELPMPATESAPASAPTPLQGAFDPLSDPLIRQLMLGQQAMQMQMAALMDKVSAPAPKATGKPKAKANDEDTPTA